jgi:hypothetical protein
MMLDPTPTAGPPVAAAGDALRGLLAANDPASPTVRHAVARYAAVTRAAGLLPEGMVTSLKALLAPVRSAAPATATAPRVDPADLRAALVTTAIVAYFRAD